MIQCQLAWIGCYYYWMDFTIGRGEEIKEINKLTFQLNHSYAQKSVFEDCIKVISSDESVCL